MKVPNKIILYRCSAQKTSPCLIRFLERGRPLESSELRLESAEKFCPIFITAVICQAVITYHRLSSCMKFVKLQRGAYK